MNRSRIGGYVLGGAVIVFGNAVMAAVLTGAVWMAVGLLR